MRLLLSVLIGCSLLWCPLLQSAEPEALGNLRATFLEGERAASQGQTLLARQHLQHLRDADYILAPYLELSIMLIDLHRVPDAEATAFMQQYAGTWLGEKLRLNWLVVLRSRHDYQGYVDLFVPGTGTAAQQCFYYEALYRLGQQQLAFQGARDLWLVGESQSSGCDWLFARWRSSDSYSEEMLWQRFILARRAGETALGRYLESIVHDPQIKLRMQAYHKIRAEPEVLANTQAFIDGGIAYSEVIAQGLRNLAERDLELSLRLWPTYQRAGVMAVDDQAYAMEALLEQLHDRGRDSDALGLARQHPNLLRTDRIAQHMAYAARRSSWRSVLAWLDLIPPSSATDEAWVYWRARASYALGEDASPLFEQLAGQRSYYGFLASLQTRRGFNLNDRSSPPRTDWQPEPRVAQALKSAIELESVGYSVNARLSWQHAMRLLSEEEAVQAAWWASASGYHFLAIQATIETGAWDQLDIRFPLAYLDEFSQSADREQMPLAWLFAISRQESSFAADIQSPAGARGLMQLMPGTAREMARQADLAYESQRLTEPDYNIRLGTSYLAMAYQELQSNPVWATAAYNAGIARVKSWLRAEPESLPLDVWIESIPFNETRNYVKNVLAYSVIYGAKLGQPSLMEILGPQFFTAWPSQG